MTKPDANQDAARIVADTTKADDLPADVEAAWEAWKAGIKGVDERGWTLLRAAFEAGVEAGQSKESS